MSKHLFSKTPILHYLTLEYCVKKKGHIQIKCFLVIVPPYETSALYMSFYRLLCRRMKGASRGVCLHHKESPAIEPQPCIIASGDGWGYMASFSKLATLYATRPSTPSGTSFLAFSWKYLSLEPFSIAAIEPMPLYTLYLRP